MKSAHYWMFHVFSDKAIPSTNIDLHYAHCSRNLERCKHCGDMVPKKHAEEHYLNTHAAVGEFILKSLLPHEIPCHVFPKDLFTVLCK